MLYKQSFFMNAMAAARRNSLTSTENLFLGDILQEAVRQLQPYYMTI
jgi:hypothetical protein